MNIHGVIDQLIDQYVSINQLTSASEVWSLPPAEQDKYLELLDEKFNAQFKAERTAGVEYV